MIKAILLVAVLCCGAFAQSQGTASPTPSGVNSNSTAGAAAVFNQGDTTSIQHRQFPGAVPGTYNPGPFPGYPMSNGGWQLYYPATYRKLSMPEVRSMKMRSGIWPGNWKKRVRSVVLVQGAIPANDDPITLLGWWPKAISRDTDKILGVVTVTGDYLNPEEGPLGLGLEMAKKLTGTRRVAIRVREVKEGVTKGWSIGTGGAAARITQPGLDNDAVAVATGGVLGTNRVRAEEWPEFEILCLNDGSSEAPEMPGPPPESRSVPAPLPQVVLPSPPQKQEVVVRVEVVQVPPQVPSVLPPSPIPPAQAKEAECEAPFVTIYFDFAKYQLKPEYRSKIGEVAAWMAGHKTCQLQVEGHTCRIGSEAYNAALGRNRAETVYKTLIAAGVSKDQVTQFPSLGKDRPASEHLSENRRVILRIIGPASGK